MDFKLFGPEEGGLTYLLRNRTARLISGDPDLTQALIDATQGRQRFTAGVLSETQTLDPKVREEAIHGVEYQLRAGMLKESVNFTWIRHTEKGRDESHLVTPKIELITGHPFTPYVDRTDRRRIAAWQEHFNLTHGLPDPSSRLRVRPDYSKSRLPAEHQKILMEVWNLLHDKVEAGLVTSRREIVAVLQSGGYNIRPETYAGRPLEQPVLTLPDGCILRLKGSLYYRVDFTPDMLVPKQEQATPEVVKARIDELRVIVARGLEFRAHHTIGRLFGRAEQRRVERGTARNHLAHLLRIKLSDWEVAEPIHPMFSNERIHELHRLIKLQCRGQNLLQVPVLQDIVARNPKALSGHVITDKIPEQPQGATPSVIPPKGKLSETIIPENSLLTDMAVFPMRTVAAVPEKRDDEEKSSVPEVPTATPPPAPISTSVIRKKSAAGKRKHTKQKTPIGPTNPG